MDYYHGIKRANGIYVVSSYNVVVSPQKSQTKDTSLSSPHANGVLSTNIRTSGSQLLSSPPRDGNRSDTDISPIHKTSKPSYYDPNTPDRISPQVDNLVKRSSPQSTHSNSSNHTSSHLNTSPSITTPYYSTPLTHKSPPSTMMSKPSAPISEPKPTISLFSPQTTSNHSRSTPSSSSRSFTPRVDSLSYSSSSMVPEMSMIVIPDWLNTSQPDTNGRLDSSTIYGVSEDDTSSLNCLEASMVTIPYSTSQTSRSRMT